MRDGEIGEKYALILGVSEYDNKDLEPLAFCKKDGDAMYDLLTSPSLGYQVPPNRKLIGEVESN